MTALLALLTAAGALAEPVVNLYSALGNPTSNHDDYSPLYQGFTESTGIHVDLVQDASPELLYRIEREGEFSPADLLVDDAGDLWRARQRGLLQPVRSALLHERIPAHLRDQDGYWFGLSKRVRVIVVNRGRDAPDVSRYEDLAGDRAYGELCMRLSFNRHNISLLASLIEHHGEAGAEDWAQGVAANLARPPQGGVAAQLRAVAAGECGVTIASAFHVGRLLGSASADDRAVAANLRVVFPNQADRGAHVDVGGAGVLRRAPNRDNAVRLLEYLASDSAQRWLAASNQYPVVGDAAGATATLGAFKEDTLNATAYAVNQALAARIFDRAGWW